MTNLILQFKAKITNGQVKIPALNTSHVIQGDKLYYTERSLQIAAQELGLFNGLRPIETPRLEHISGDFIGTFRIDLGTFKQRKAATKAKQAIVNDGWKPGTETLADYETRIHKAVLAAYES